MVNLETIRDEISMLEDERACWKVFERLAVLYAIEERLEKEDSEIGSEDDELEDDEVTTVGNLRTLCNGLSKEQLVNVLCNHARAMKEHGHVSGWNKLVNRVRRASKGGTV